MSDVAPETSSWSRRRWVAVVFSIFVLHLGALSLVSSRREKVQHLADSRASVHWLTDPASARKIVDSLLLTDPTQFAMVHPRGFSGTAWLRTSLPEYRPAEWADEGRSLAQPANLLGGAFRQAAPAGEQPVFDPARKPIIAPPALVVSQPALRLRSQMLVEGAVRLRPLAQPPLLKSWPHADVLADSRVQVLVTAEGLVFSPRLIGIANAKDPVQQAADRHAVDLARQLRFEPAAKNSRASAEGVLIFQWHTTEPAAPAKP
ncbi:MAG: hypothetical protein HZA92_09155 [Verrucomicrobia bacterium]|nr:hypothetical protein [Verrucomicrobiota bacterium]